MRTRLLSLGRSQRATGEDEVLRLGQPKDPRSALSATGAGYYTEFCLGETDLRDRVPLAGERVRIW
jgi:hypothetical protein